MTKTPKNIEYYLQEMSKKGVWGLEDIQGCSPSEIEKLEAKFNVTLPASYKSFLLAMGKNFGGLVDKNDLSIDYDAVLEMNDYERRITQECKEEDPSEEIHELPDKALLILRRCDGGQFYYILAEGGEDSSVYYYNIDSEVDEKAHDSFWDVLEMFLRGQVVAS